MLERVLIPLDGTADSESLFPVLEPILRRRGSEIFLVQTVPPPGRGSLQEADRYLRGVADRFPEGACVHTLVGVGSAPQVIESLAAGEEVTLIAMPSRGDAVGPVLERLLRGSMRPVVALSPAQAPVSRKTAPARKTILAPLDGSPASRRSVPLALELAGALDARVILMRVLERESEEAEALHDLHDVAHRMARLGLVAEIWIESGDPTEKILQVSRDEDVQMVVLTTQGRSESGSRLFGHVTREILKRSPMPVLAVHARG
jgi:nucleotide-binding universal stress UspA family protein